MKPYLVHQTWVDLDAVIAISDFTFYQGSSSVRVYGMFHSGGIDIHLGNPTYRYIESKDWKDCYDLAPQRVIYDALVDARKGRVTK